MQSPRLSPPPLLAAAEHQGARAANSPHTNGIIDNLWHTADAYHDQRVLNGHDEHRREDEDNDDDQRRQQELNELLDQMSVAEGFGADDGDADEHESDLDDEHLPDHHGEIDIHGAGDSELNEPIAPFLPPIPNAGSFDAPELSHASYEQQATQDGHHHQQQHILLPPALSLSQIRDQYDAALAELRQEYEHSLQSIQTSEGQKRAALQSQVDMLQRELEMARANNTSIASIRATLQREKELDILGVKKELLSQKEQQLLKMRAEFTHDKEELIKRYREELARKEEEHQHDHQSLTTELDAVRRAADQLREQIAQHEAAARSKPVALDFAQQFESGALADLRRSHVVTSKELADVRAQIARMITDWTEPSYPLTCLDVLDVLRAQVEYDTAALQRAKRENETLSHKLRDAEQHTDIRIAQLLKELDARTEQLHTQEESHRQVMRDMTSKTEQAQADLVTRHKQEMATLSEKLKEQCRKLYEASIEKFKDEFKLLDKRLRDKYDDEGQARQSQLHAQMEHDAQLKQERIQSLEERVMDLQRTNKSLQDSLTAQATTVNMLKQTYAEEKEQALQKLKAQYLETLKSLRQDILASKRRNGVLAPQTRYTFTPEQRHRAQTVLHLRAGDPFTVFDRECKEYRAELLNPAGSFQTGDVQRALQADGVKGVRLSLVFSPLKHDRTTNVLEKATEVGVSRFAPALCQRSVVTRVNLDKWKRTTVEAAEQSDRLSLPSLVPMAPLDKQVDQLQQVSPRALLLLVDEAAPLAADTQPIVQTLVELVKKNAEVQDQDTLELCSFDEATCVWHRLAVHPLFETVVSAVSMPVLVKRDTTFSGLDMDSDDDDEDDGVDRIMTDRETENVRNGDDDPVAADILLAAQWEGGDIIVYAGDSGFLTFMAVADMAHAAVRFIALERLKVADVGSLNFCQLGKLLAIDPLQRSLCTAALQDHAQLQLVTPTLSLRYGQPLRIGRPHRLNEFTLWIFVTDVRKELAVQFLDCSQPTLSMASAHFQEYRFAIEGFASPLHLVPLKFHPESFFLVTERKVYLIHLSDMLNGNSSPGAANVPCRVDASDGALVTAVCPLQDPFINYVYMCQANGTLCRVSIDNRQPSLASIGLIAANTTRLVAIGRGPLQLSDQETDTLAETTADILLGATDAGDMEIILVSEAGIHERIPQPPTPSPALDVAAVAATVNGQVSLYSCHGGCGSYSGVDGVIAQLQYGTSVGVLSSNASMDYASVVNMWSLKAYVDGAADSMILLSFAAETRALILQDGAFQDISSECALDTAVSTLFACSLRHEQCVVQVRSTGVILTRFVVDDIMGECRGEQLASWTAPTGSTIMLAASAGNRSLLLAEYYEETCTLVHLSCTREDGMLTLSRGVGLRIPYMPAFITAATIGHRHKTSSEIYLVGRHHPAAALFVYQADHQSNTVQEVASYDLPSLKSSTALNSCQTFAAGSCCKGRTEISKLLNCQGSLLVPFQIAEEDADSNTFMVISNGQLQFVQLAEPGLTSSFLSVPEPPRRLFHCKWGHSLIYASYPDPLRHTCSLRLVSLKDFSCSQTITLGLGDILLKQADNIPADVSEIVLCMSEWHVSTKNSERRFLLVGTGLRASEQQTFCGGRFLVFRAEGTDTAALQSDPWGQETILEHPVRAIHQLSRMDILIGVGQTVARYTLSKRSKEVDHVKLQNVVTCIQSVGDVIAVGTAHSSIVLLRHADQTRKLEQIAADCFSRSINDIVVWNGCFVTSDRLGNLCGMAYDPAAEEFAMSPLFQYRIGRQVHRLCKGRLRLQPSKLALGDSATDTTDTCQIGDDAPAIIAQSLLGSVDVVIPVPSQHSELLTQLQRVLLMSPLVRPAAYDAFRSTFYPMLHVVDGDVCQLFQSLSPSEKKQVTRLVNTYAAAERANAEGSIVADGPQFTVQDIEEALTDASSLF
ncbi:hypothetical protein RI367_002096 [Sorochytrium milnesiophthora]